MRVPRPASSVLPPRDRPSRCTWLLALLCVVLGSPEAGRSQDSDPEALLGAVIPSSGDTSLESTLEDSRTDPSLGGKLHLDYRLTYQGRFYDHRPYEFPFPGELTPIDEQFAAELKALHDDEEDQDLDQYLSIRTHNLFTAGRSSGLYQNFDTELSLRYFRDIDGTPPRTTAVSIFRDEEFQLRTLNARVEMLQRHLELTLGRQYVDNAAEWVHIDGGKAAVRGLGLFDRPVEIEAFAGRRVAFYRTIDRKEIYGGRISYLPSRDTRIELSDVYYIDNTFRAEVFQRFHADWTGLVSYRQINLDPESLRFETSYRDASRGLDMRASYLGKLGVRSDDFNFDYTFSDRVSGDDADHDRRFNISDVKPFDEFGLDVHYELTERWGAFAGGTVHEQRAGDPDAYNTDWYEVWAGVDVNHVPWEGLTGRLTLRYLDTDLPRRRFREPDDPLYLVDIVGDGEPDFLSLALLLEQGFGKDYALGAQVNFKSYSYDSRFARLDHLDALAVDGYFRVRLGAYTTCYVAVSYETDADYVSADFDELLGVRAQLQVSW